MISHYVAPSRKETKKDVAKRMGEFLTDDDIHRFLGQDTQIVKYSQLKFAPNIEVLLPEAKCQIIILVESSYNKGHWCSIARDGFKIIAFDSYGSKIDTEMSYIPSRMRALLGEQEDEIKKLMKRSPGYSFEYNKIKFQSMKKEYGVVPATCGRWCVLFVWFMRQNYTLKMMQEYMANLKEETGFPYDFLICLLVK